MTLLSANVIELLAFPDFSNVKRGGVGTETTYPDATFNYGYDADGNMISASSASFGSVSYGYNSNNNHLRSVSTSWGQSFGFSFDGVGRLIQISRPTGVTNFTYSGSSAITNIQHLSGSTQSSFASYTYDGRNFPLSKTNPIGTENYVTDLDGQLTSSTGIAADTYSYDPLGNRITDSKGSYNYDPTGQRLTSDWEYTYAYDKNGNLTAKYPVDPTKQAYSFAYNSKNQLIEAKVINGGALGTLAQTITFAYDGVGRRMEKKVVDNINSSNSYSRRFVYNGDTVIAELDGSNLILAQYSHSPLAQDDVLGVQVTSQGATDGLAQSSGSYYFLKDALGSVTDVTDSSGNVVQRVDYSPFGKVRKFLNGQGVDITAHPTINTPYLFTGREFDQETGLYYYRARYYDSDSGRFLQEDPYTGSLMNPLGVINKFIYAGNSPIRNTDPSGRSFNIGPFLVRS